MADIKTVTIGSTVYDIKDATAREEISDVKSNLNGFADGKIQNDITPLLGGAINNSTGAFANLSGYDTWAYTDFIKIPDNTKLIESNFNQAVGGSSTFGFAIYNANKEYIIGGQNLAVVPILSNYKYIRMTDYKANSDHSGLYIKFIIGRMSLIDDDILTKYKVFTPIETAEGKYVSLSSGVINKYNIAGSGYKKYDIADYVGKNLCLTCSRIDNPYNMFAIIANSSEGMITVIQLSTLTRITDYMFNVPANSKYIYINYKLSDAVCELRFADFSKNYIADNQSIASKSCVCYGDSITWYDGQTYNWGKFNGQLCVGYESYLAKEFGLLVGNRGTSGATSVQICNSLKSANLTRYNYLVLTAGANDERHNTTLGTVLEAGSTFDANTFCGAFQSAIEYALSQNAEMKIILCTPIQGWIYENGFDDTDYPDHPTSAYIDEKWANAIRRIAAVYSLPVCDWYAESGINLSTRNVYINDPEPPTNDQYSLHPTPKGYERISEILISTFKKVMPV